MPWLPACVVEPRPACRIGSKRNDRPVPHLGLPAPSAGMRIGTVRIAIQPLDDAALVGGRFCLGPRLPPVMFGDTGTLVIERPPVPGGPRFLICRCQSVKSAKMAVNGVVLLAD